MSTPLWVTTVELDTPDGRQIGPRTRAAELLRERRGDIEAALAEAAEIVQTSAARNAASEDRWGVASVEATFGLTLTAEAGVLLSRVSAEAVFEVTLKIERLGQHH